MLLFLEHLPEHLSAWSETCPCHGHLQMRYTGHVPTEVSVREFGQEHAAHLYGLGCPMRGCRSAEMAAGEAFEQLDACFADAKAELAQRWRASLTADQ
eukprot:2261820-Lingulodinium_polyedra.AAC.1